MLRLRLLLLLADEAEAAAAAALAFAAVVARLTTRSIRLQLYNLVSSGSPVIYEPVAITHAAPLGSSRCPSRCASLGSVKGWAAASSAANASPTRAAAVVLKRIYRNECGGGGG